MCCLQLEKAEKTGKYHPALLLCKESHGLLPNFSSLKISLENLAQGREWDEACDVRHRFFLQGPGKPSGRDSIAHPCVIYLFATHLNPDPARPLFFFLTHLGRVRAADRFFDHVLVLSNALGLRFLALEGFSRPV